MLLSQTRVVKTGLREGLLSKIGRARARYSFKKSISKIRTQAKKSIPLHLSSRNLIMECRVREKTWKLKTSLMKSQRPSPPKSHQPF